MEWPAARAEQLAANCASELQQQGFAVVPDLLTQSQLEELRMVRRGGGVGTWRQCRRRWEAGGRRMGGMV